jgi:iron complex outermembrane receptor protein
MHTTILTAIAAVVFSSNLCAAGTLQQGLPDTVAKTLPRIDVRTPRADEHSPVTHTTITPATLRQLHVGQDPQYIVERAVPSIVAFSESGTGMTNYGSFRLRGIDQTRVNVTLDGVPINDMLDQGVFFSNMSDLTNGMASIQVQRGIGMSMNGTASFAGSVNFETNAGQDLPTAHLELGAGSFDMRRASASVSTGTLKGGIHAFVRYTSLQSEGYRTNTATSTNSVLFSGGWTGEADALRILGVWGRSANELGYFAVPASIARRAPRTNLNDITDNDNFGQHLLQLRYTRTLSSSETFSTAVYYGGAGGDYFSGFRDSSNMLTQINYPLENRHIGAMANITSTGLAEGLRVEGGLHAYQFNRRNWETVSPENRSPYYDDRTIKREASLYARATYLSNAWQIYADVQARSVTMQFVQDVPNMVAAMDLPTHAWFFLNPRVGARYSLDDASEVYVSFGQTGREPTRFDLLGSTQINDANVGVLRVPNTVRPEFVMDLEAGYRVQGTNGRLAANFFLMRFQDEIAPIGPFIEQQFVQLRKNVARSRRIGVEVEGLYRFHRTLSVEGNFTWMSARVDEYVPENVMLPVVYTNVFPVLTPNLLGNVMIRYSPVQLISVDVAARGMSRSFADISNSASATLPAFLQLDTRLWLSVFEGMRVGLHVNNVTNAFVVTNGGSMFGDGGLESTYFVQAGRNFMITATMDF